MHVKKRILIDVNPIVNSTKSGVGYFTYGLVESLSKQSSNNATIVGHYFNFLGLKKNILLPHSQNITYKVSKILHPKILSFTRKFGFQLPLELLFRKSGDVAIFTNFVSLPSLYKTPTLVAIYDLCFEEVPEYVSDKNQAFLHKFVPKSVKNSSKTITISESTKKAIKKYYGVKDEDIIITPIPPSPPVFKGKEFIEKFNINKKYILFVSNLEPRKNFINLVKAYENLPSKTQKQYSLVLVGGYGWKIEDQLEYIKNAQKNGTDVVLTGYVSDDERASLYTNASLFVMPSHYEGFGMPILEAMSYGLPTAISNIPVFHEVAGDASLFFNKDDPKDIAKTMVEILNNKTMRDEIIAKSKKQLKKYEWADIAKNLYKEIEKII